MNKAFTEQLDVGLERAQNGLSKSSTHPDRQSACALYARIVFVLVLLTGLFFAAPWYVIHQYNELQRKQAAVDTQWRQMVNHYARCADFGRRLAEVLTFHAVDETKKLGGLVNAAGEVTASAKAGAFSQNQQALDKLQAAHNQFSHSLSELLLVVKAHPELVASTRLQDMAAQLEVAETRLVYSRQRYMVAIVNYDSASSRFPARLVAMLLEKPAWPLFRTGHQSLRSVVPAASDRDQDRTARPVPAPSSS